MPSYVLSLAVVDEGPWDADERQDEIEENLNL
jgi:hypothetical protein